MTDNETKIPAAKAHKDGKTARKSPEQSAHASSHKVRRPERPEIIGAFVERGGGAKFNALLSGYGVFFSVNMTGKGTATSEILDILGLDDSQRDVVFALAAPAQARAVISKVNDKLSGRSFGKGIAFRMALSAAPNLLATALTLKSGGKYQTEAQARMDGEKFTLILLSVNQGYADEVMAIAKKAGARGGTLIRANQTATEEAQSLFGSAFSAEREIIAMLTSADKRNDIMNAVNTESGMRSEAGTVAIALSVDDVAKLT